MRRDESRILTAAGRRKSLPAKNGWIMKMPRELAAGIIEVILTCEILAAPI
jgi:hypothetical protein